MSAVHDFPAEVAGYAFLQAVRMVAADDDQLGAEFVGLLEDELRQPLRSVAVDVGGSFDAGFDQSPSHGFAESERLGDRLLLERRGGGDDALPHVDHEHLGVERFGQAGDDWHELSGVLGAPDRDHDLGKHEAIICFGRPLVVYDRRMAGRVQHYRAELKKRRGEWEPYLKANSGLPGPRANLELVAAVGEEADADLLWRLSASSDEFLAVCGTAGLGRLDATDSDTVLPWLRELAEDPRWRVREGVAIALQRLGRTNMAQLIAEMEVWSKDGPLVQRAAAAGLCEPPLLKKADEIRRVLLILDHITRSMAATKDRKLEGFRVLRQAMGYCWSVAAAANPAAARPLFVKWLRSSDPDIAWVMSSNLGKARLTGFRKSVEESKAKRPVRTPPKKKPAA